MFGLGKIIKGAKKVVKVAAKGAPILPGVPGAIAAKVGNVVRVEAKVPESKPRRLNGEDVRSVGRGSLVAAGGGGIGLTLFYVAMEWGLLPGSILGKPTSLALVVLGLGAAGSVVWNLVRKFLASHPEIEVVIKQVLPKT